MSTSIAPLEHFQLQSPLIRLPAEIKHMIYSLCFAANNTIVDPTIADNWIQSTHTPSLGLSLLQTCRRLYHEADRRLMFSQNTFCFTNFDRAKSFFDGLDEHHRSSVQDVEIDVGKLGVNWPQASCDWTKYVTGGNDPGNEMPKSLQKDAPRLKTLRLNFSTWPRTNVPRSALWPILKQLLDAVHIQGLERIVLTGASKGQGMARRDPWSLAHYVGTTDDDLNNDLISRMWRCIEAPGEAKLVRWVRGSGKIQLEVVSRTHLLRHVDDNWSGPSIRKACTDPWPENGSCLWSGYEDRNLNGTNPAM